MADLEVIRETLKKYDVVFFDIETNGLEVSSEILEVGAIKYKAGELFDAHTHGEVFHSLIYFDGVPNYEAFKVNKMDPVLLREHGRPMKEVIGNFIQFSRDTIVVGHNIKGYDLRLVEYQAGKYAMSMRHKGLIDTLHLAREVVVGLNSYRLGSVAQYYKISHEPTHRAIDDVMANVEVFCHLVGLQRSAPQQVSLL